MTEQRMTILANNKLSRGKYAAAAVHAALNHYGVEHGAVIVLGQTVATIERECDPDTLIRDAGRTEVSLGTITAGIREVRTSQGWD